MKFQRFLRHTLVSAIIILICSCHHSVELVKRKYMPGYYIATTGEKKTPTVIHKKNALDSLLCMPVKEVSFLKPSVINSDDLVASTERIETKKATEPYIKSVRSSVAPHDKHDHFRYLLGESFHPEETKPAPTAIPMLNKIAIMFLLLCLLSLAFALASYVFRSVPFLSSAGAIFPELWLIGIALAIIGFFKSLKNADPTNTEPKRLNRFSKIAFILEILGALNFLLIVPATFLILYSIMPLLILVYLLSAISLISFTFSTIGLIKTLQDPEQLKKNKLKAILISILSLVPIGLMIAWFIAVGTFLSAAIPYFAFLLFILH